MKKNCEICAKELTTKRIFNMEIPSMIGHEDCMVLLKEQDLIKKNEQIIKKRKEEIANIIKKGFSDAAIDWRARTFDTWVENSENKPVVEFLKQWGINDKGLSLSGLAGVGKTHLLAALATHLATEKLIDFQFLRFPIWSDKMRSVNFEQAEQMVLEIQNVNLLFLDDIGANTITDHIESKFCRILDYRLEFKLPLFITTNLSSEDLKNTFSTRIVSRLFGLCDWIELDKLKKDWRIYGR